MTRPPSSSSGKPPVTVILFTVVAPIMTAEKVGLWNRASRIVASTKICIHALNSPAFAFGLFGIPAASACGGVD